MDKQQFYSVIFLLLYIIGLIALNVITYSVCEYFGVLNWWLVLALCVDSGFIIKYFVLD